MSKTVAVTVTGAAGQIGYALLFRIASGAMLGNNTRIDLRLLEVPQAIDALKGVAMELQDCAFNLLDRVLCTDNTDDAFDGCQYALLVGAQPRKAGMERKDLLAANANIFAAQGIAINQQADPNIRVLVVGNPANTNAMITAQNAPKIPPAQITAMTRLDHNRARGILAKKIQAPISDVRQLTIWGNHSTSQYPDLHHAMAADKAVIDTVSTDWYHNTYIAQVQERGAAVIAARGSSSAASAANAAIEHMRDWILGTPQNDWTSMGVMSDGSYSIEPGLVYSFPVRCQSASWSIVQDLSVNDYSRRMMDASMKELQTERDALKNLLAN